MADSKDYGRRLIITILDDMARAEPDRIVYSIPLTQDVSKGFREVTASDFANAINRTAWWVESELGKGTECAPVGFIGPHTDFRYILLILGCVKAGYAALLPSPRNSIDGTLNVLNGTKCDIWVTPKERPEVLPQLLDRRPMKVIEIPETEELMRTERVKDYPYTKTFDEAASEPFCILHSSGTTGLPKPIIWKNSMLGTLDATRLLPPSESDGRRPWTDLFNKNERLYTAFPLHHSAGLTMNVLIHAFHGTSNVIGPVGVLPTINLIDSLLDNTNIKIWSIIPSIVDEIGETPTISAKFRSSKIIIASGGPVTYGSANKATKDVRIFNLTGTTEGLFQGITIVEPENWIYFNFHPWAGFDFRELDNGVHEHWAVRNEKHLELHQGIFHTFPNDKELTYKDLYAPHPTKPNLWVYRGRLDDLLVMSNGEKVRPNEMEAIINSHPAVNSCLMIGTGYPMTSLLVELARPEPSNPQEREALLDSILEKVHVANSIGSKPSHIFREYIWFSKPGKPFARTDKGTVKRRDTMITYEDDIKEFYKSMEEDGNVTADIDFTTPSTIARDVRRLLVGAGLPSTKELGPDDNILQAGIDSLGAASIANSLRSALKKHDVSSEGTKTPLTAKFVYAHPTVNALSNALQSLVNKTADKIEDPVDLQRKSVDKLLAKYTTGGSTVILTGSTGSLGSYLLDTLVHHQNGVNKVYCLNRSEDGETRQKAAAELRGLATEWPSEKVEFLQVDLSRPKLGLSEKVYNNLLEQTTHIIHNQWPVNYNWDIESFEPQIRGVRNLVDFSRNSTHDAHLFFVSSAATVNHLKPNGAVPETPNHVITTTLDGYGSSKHVSELILEEAVARFGIKASVCRVGQIAGPVLRGREKGMWQKQEWVPTLIASSKYLGALPSSLGSMSRVDWIPVDLLADILVQLAGAVPVEGTNGIDGTNGLKKVNGSSATSQGGLPVYHAVNPNPVDWSSLVPTVEKHLGESVKVVPWAEWMETLRDSTRGATAKLSLTQNPALKLLDYFESLAKEAENGKEMPALETKQTLKKSPRMAGLKPVSEEWMSLWLEQWKF